MFTSHFFVIFIPSDEKCWPKKVSHPRSIIRLACNLYLYLSSIRAVCFYLLLSLHQPLDQVQHRVRGRQAFLHYLETVETGCADAGMGRLQGQQQRQQHWKEGFVSSFGHCELLLQLKHIIKTFLCVGSSLQYFS